MHLTISSRDFSNTNLNWFKRELSLINWNYVLKKNECWWSIRSILEFTWISFSQASDYTNRAISDFFENLRRYSQHKVNHRCCWHRWQMEKIFNQKNCHYFFWTHLGSRFSTQIHFLFKFILSCQQSDTVPIVCHRCCSLRWQSWLRCCWYWWQVATGVIVTGGNLPPVLLALGKFATCINNTSETDSKICRRCRWYSGAPWLANIFANFQTNSKQS